MEQKINKYLIGAIFLSLSVLSFFLLEKGHNWGDDFALYINQARSLTHGTVYDLQEKNTYSINHSSFHTFSPTLAPWGWPIILSPFVYFFGLNISVFKLLNCVLFLCFLIVFFKLIRKEFNLQLSLLTIVFLGTNIKYLKHLNNILTETPFLLLSTTTLLFIQNYNYKDFRVKMSLLLGLLIFISFYVRSEGFMLIIALFFWQLKSLLKQKFRIDTSFIIYLLLPVFSAISWYVLFSFLLPNGFLTHFNDSSLISYSKLLGSAEYYLAALNNMSTNNFNIFLFSFLIVLFVVGLIKNFYQDIHISMYLLSLIVVYLIWPFNEFRYLFVFYPIIVYFIVVGCKYLLTFYEKGSFRVYYLLFALLIALNVIRIKKDFTGLDHRIENYGPEKGTSVKMFDFIRKNSSKNDVIVFFRPRAMTLYTDRRSIMIFDDWKNVLKKGNYIVLYKAREKYFQFSPKDNFIASNSFKKNFILKYENTDFAIYRILKSE